MESRSEEWWENSCLPQPPVAIPEVPGESHNGYPPQPLQTPEHLDPTLRSQPWHDASNFAWCLELERNFEAIRQEALRALGDGSWPMVRGQVGLTGGKGEWRELVMLGPGSERGRRLCPHTASLLESVAPARHLADSIGACGNAIFAQLTPGTRLKPHCGPTNTRLTCHLGIEVPSGCAIRVGTETRRWQQGKCLVFDDSWEHEVWNTGTSVRIVLLVNFWHPDLPAALWDETAHELQEGFLDS
eukprot:TRINITY_DN112233_c0_g1_i1.p1 TRINITY_DN112233_c0_g1~~TRINITY_DN112233_c0_g1_i1.p1  ORF type:complete len:264 (+),score=46.88 TRINITY_DN112233_c0_g1_i1:62-793(+)